MHKKQAIIRPVEGMFIQMTGYKVHLFVIFISTTQGCTEKCKKKKSVLWWSAEDEIRTVTFNAVVPFWLVLNYIFLCIVAISTESPDCFI